MVIKLLTNLLLCVGAGLLWWYGNIELGNLQALDYLGWLKGYPWYIPWIVAILPSVSQLFLTEQWGEEELDAISMIFAAFVGIVVDLGGPVLGFFVVTDLPFNIWTLLPAIMVAAFVSILCQHVAWVRGKALVALLFGGDNNPPAKKRPIRLADKLPAKQKRQYPNGREVPHDSEALAKYD